VSVLQFIDAMTGRLAWPLTALTLGLIFRRSLTGLFARIRTLRWGDGEAELTSVNEAALELESAAREAEEKLPGNAADSELERRARLAAVMERAFKYGFRYGRNSPVSSENPILDVSWDESGSPRLHLLPSRTKPRWVDPDGNIWEFGHWGDLIRRVNGRVVEISNRREVPTDWKPAA
jgi:hypothetical protein